MSVAAPRDHLSAASAVVRNPLSVIALFVLLVEAIATVTLVNVVTAPLIAVPLVWFVVSFPTLIALLFFATLWWRHQFLYSPMEYRSDESFLTAMQRLQRVEAKQEAADLNPNTAGEAQSMPVVDRLMALGDLRSAVKVGRTFLEAQQYEAANRIFEHILQNSPRNHEDRYNAVSNLAYSEIGLRKYDAAIKHLNEAITLAGDKRTGPWHYVALAYSHFKLSAAEGDEHRKAFEKYLALAKKHPWYKYNQASFSSIYPEIADRF